MLTRNMGLMSFKLCATLLVAVGLLYPFANPDARSGVLASVWQTGWLPVSAVVLAFLAAVGLYCRSLQRCLEQIGPAARAAKPASVWLMFLLPYNFVEDFFIVGNVSRSIRAEAATNARLAGLTGFGFVSGFGWCAAQIVSLLPNAVGELAGGVALLCWGVHWRLVVKVNRLLSAPGERVAAPDTSRSPQ
ncbi:hypothetical protein [Cupriavidus basilensis]|uniref:hypothetical protein n=1 Tax=Cupriavidus basilensis TaxID=68895 RepID=UPI0039F6C3CD